MTNGEDETVASGYQGRILLAITGGTFFISLVAMVLPPLLPAIQEDLQISSGQAGLLLTVWWLIIALTNVPGGRLADQLSHKTGLIAGSCIAVLGIVILLNAEWYLLLLFGIGLTAIGRGIYMPSAIGQIADLFVERRGQALGIRGAALNLGGVVSGALAALVLAVATWQTVFVPILVGVLLVIVAVHAWNRESYVVDRVHVDLRETVARLKRGKNILPVIIALAMFGFMWNGTISFLPSFLQFGKGFSTLHASIAFSGVFVIGMVVQPVSGAVGDRVGHAATACLAATLCTIGLVGLLVTGHVVLIGASLGVYSLGLASFWPVATAMGLERLSAGTLAGDWGAITAIFLSTEALGSVYVGVAIDLSNYILAFTSLLGLLVGTIIVTLWLAIFD